jgi:hypothetical protein
MTSRRELSSALMLLVPLLFLVSEAHTQAAKDPRRDLSVSFSSRAEGTDPGIVFGAVRNNSANLYPCVRIEFNLITRFDLRKPGEEARQLGTLPVEVPNVQPRSTRDYQQPLPFPAGIGLKSVGECPAQPAKQLPDAPEILSFTVTPARISAGQTATVAWRTANTDRVSVGERNPEFPHASLEPIRAPRVVEPSGSMQVSPSRTTNYSLEAKKGAASVVKSVTVEVTTAPPTAATCTISGRILGQLKHDTKDDRGQPISFTLTRMAMTTPGDAKPVLVTLGGKDGRDYAFTKLQAGRTYKIFPSGFRSEPPEISVDCLRGEPHTGKNFRITGPPPSG